MDRQRQTTELFQVDLPISRKPLDSEIPDELIAKQPNLLAAIRLCIHVSGLQDNEIYPRLKMANGNPMEKAQFSKCLSGIAHFPPNLIEQVQDICGNEIPLRWQALRRSYDLTPKRSKLERELEETRLELRQAINDLDVIRKFVKETS